MPVLSVNAGTVGQVLREYQYRTTGQFRTLTGEVFLSSMAGGNEDFRHRKRYKRGQVIFMPRVIADIVGEFTVKSPTMSANCN